MNPKDKFIVPKVIWKLLKKKMGFRTLLDVIPLEAELIKGSHGRIPEGVADWPILISNRPELLKKNTVEATEVYSILYNHITHKS